MSPSRGIRTWTMRPATYQISGTFAARPSQFLAAEPARGFLVNAVAKLLGVFYTLFFSGAALSVAKEAAKFCLVFGSNQSRQTLQVSTWDQIAPDEQPAWLNLNGGWWGFRPLLNWAPPFVKGPPKNNNDKDTLPPIVGFSQISFFGMIRKRSQEEIRETRHVVGFLSLRQSHLAAHLSHFQACSESQKFE